MTRKKKYLSDAIMHCVMHKKEVLCGCNYVNEKHDKVEHQKTKELVY